MIENTIAQMEPFWTLESIWLFNRSLCCRAVFLKVLCSLLKKPSLDNNFKENSKRNLNLKRPMYMMIEVNQHCPNWNWNRQSNLPQPSTCQPCWASAFVMSSDFNKLRSALIYLDIICLMLNYLSTRIIISIRTHKRVRALHVNISIQHYGTSSAL